MEQPSLLYVRLRQAYGVTKAADALFHFVDLIDSVLPWSIKKSRSFCAASVRVAFRDLAQPRQGNAEIIIHHRGH